MGSRRRDAELCSHVLHAAGVGFWAWDVVDDVLTADRHCEEIMRSAVPLGRAGPRHEEHRDLVFRPSAQAGGEFKYDRRLTYADGDARWIRVCGCAVSDEAGQVVRCVGVMRDVTDEHRLRESEQRLRFVLSAAHDGVWEIDVPTGRMWWSDDMLAMLGLPRDRCPQDVEAALAHVHPDDRAVAFGGPGDARSGPPTVRQRIVRMRDGGGGWRAVESWTVVETEPESGHVRRIAGIVHDRTHATRADDPRALARLLNNSVLGPIEAAARQVKMAALAVGLSPEQAGALIEASSAELGRARDAVEEVIQSELLRSLGRED
jgi:PAS domain-containing protein